MVFILGRMTQVHIPLGHYSSRYYTWLHINRTSRIQECVASTAKESRNLNQFFRNIFLLSIILCFLKYLLQYMIIQKQFLVSMFSFFLYFSRYLSDDKGRKGMCYGKFLLYNKLCSQNFEFLVQILIFFWKLENIFGGHTDHKTGETMSMKL